MPPFVTRRSIRDMRSAEYDAFGPWIVRVDSLDLVPRLYRDHPLDLERAVMVLKVPRNITRRDATPDMDLYDHLLVVGAERLEVLSRSASGYDVHVVEHRRVTAIDYGTDLLDGWLTLFAASTSVAPEAARRRPALTLKFNSSSEEIVEELVTALRHLALGAPDASATHGGHAVSLGLLDLGELDVGLVTAQHALVRAEPDVRTLGFHARRTVTPRDPELLERIIGAVRPTTLHAAIVCASDRELHVIRRRRWVTSTRRPEHSVGRTVLFLARCGRATVRDDAKLVGTRVFSVPAGTVTIELVVPAGSSSERALSDTLGVPLR